MTDVTKYSVFDPRIVQTKPEYAVEKGALSLTNVSFQAQTADSSSVQFNIQVPSENVFVDRAVEWTGTAVAVVKVVLGAGVTAGSSLQGIVAPSAFPLHQATSQMTATINDATVTVNTQDVLAQVLRLADMRDARRQRTCPTMLDRYAKYPDSAVVANSPLNAWDKTTESDNVPNGGFNGFYFATSSSGSTPLGTTGADSTGVAWSNGQPYAGTNIASGTTLTFNVSVRSVEKLMLPPFIFSDQYELSTGLFGVQNFQVQMNLAPNPSRSFRVATGLTVKTPLGVSAYVPITVASTVWSTNANTGGLWYGKPSLAVQFLTPALDVPLPPKSIVPYMEFPRYISTPQTDVYNNGGGLLQSQTITLPNIPDLLLIFAKPSSYDDASNGDWTLPITNISVNFDNFSGLLANHTQEQLYQMSLRNGVDMDWSEWSGYGVVPASLGSAGPSAGGRVGLAGGPLVLRPGRDFALQAGQAPGLVGNFTLQFNLTVQNFTGSTQTPNIYTVPISSGFFETIKGSSRIIKGVLTEQDILAAPAHAPSVALERPVGNGRHGGAMGGAMGGAHGGRRHGGKHGGMKAYV
jgi:hypothetical protein